MAEQAFDLKDILDDEGPENELAPAILEFWGLRENPFSITSSKGEYFYLTEQYKKVMKGIIANCKLRQGISVLIGDIGMGKTTLVKTMLPAFLRDGKTSVVYFEAKEAMSAFGFVSEILTKLKVRRPRTSVIEYFNSLQNFIETSGKMGNNIVLVIDDAQNLTPENIEVLRLLSNIEEADKGKYLQIVLAGQIGLARNLSQIDNFESRVASWAAMQRLTLEETKKLIPYRLKVAGLEPGKQIFSEKAIELMHEKGFGVPRMVVKIAYIALRQAAEESKMFIDETFIGDQANSYSAQKVIQEIEAQINERLKAQQLD